MKRLLVGIIASAAIAGPAFAGTIHVYGPGGPAPAMKEAAATFGKMNGVEVIVTFAEPQCPWMNAATAAGFLRGEVHIAVTGVNEDGDATCEFSRDANSMLRISVQTMPHIAQDYSTYLAQCSASAVALKGIATRLSDACPTPAKPEGKN